MIKKIALALLPFAGPVLAEGFSLQMPPIDCDLETDDCYIQQYMDRDPGPGAADFTCGGLTYDGHKGTDFALPNLSRMNEGVAVVASAPGVVSATRDGMADTGFTEETATAIAGRECGNGIVIRHPDGWETQYCHLRQGSILVRKGDEVQAGTPLGLVGQSGRAQFPHVHLSVRKDGEKIDPFDTGESLDCDDINGPTLWDNPPDYRPGGLIDIGFATGVPEYSDIKAGNSAHSGFEPDAPAIVIYAYAFGIREGDQIHMTIEGPGGSVIDQIVDIKRTQAQAFRAVGKKRRSAPWPEGAYVGVARLLRAGNTVNQMQAEILVSE